MIHQNKVIRFLTILGLIPSFYLLGISLIFLPSLFTDLLKDPNIENLIIIILILFGICGFLGLIFQLVSGFYSKIKLKITLQLLSIIGYLGFITFTNGINSCINIFESLKNIKENFFELYIWLSPIIITIILISVNFRLLRKNKINLAHTKP